MGLYFAGVFRPDVLFQQPFSQMFTIQIHLGKLYTFPVAIGRSFASILLSRVAFQSLICCRIDFNYLDMQANVWLGKHVRPTFALAKCSSSRTKVKGTLNLLYVVNKLYGVGGSNRGPLGQCPDLIVKSHSLIM